MRLDIIVLCTASPFLSRLTRSRLNHSLMFTAQSSRYLAEVTFEEVPHTELVQIAHKRVRHAVVSALDDPDLGGVGIRISLNLACVSHGNL